jgi:hypothetical protein
MSNPELPTVRGSSNSARMPASLTSRQNPAIGEPRYENPRGSRWSCGVRDIRICGYCPSLSFPSVPYGADRRQIRFLI